ncbi:MAG TPA: glycogen debranching N-terminal domain-containing protein [Mycobacteriales bacterium]|nr:glycogen debranching N-terminal domain-containing protein [Mycobacteriales bacterium]
MSADSGISPETGGGQPYLHEACVLVQAPSLVLSSPAGDLDSGADGFFHADVRVLSRLRVRPAVGLLAPIRADLTATDAAVFRAIVRGVGEHGADPAVLLTRWRDLAAGRLRERVELRNGGRSTVRCPVTVQAGTDLASMQSVKRGAADKLLSPVVLPDGLSWTADGRTVTLASSPKPDAIEDDLLRYEVELAPGASWECELTCSVVEEAPPLFLPVRDPSIALNFSCADDRLTRLVEQSMSDLGGLLLADPEDPVDLFLGAGAPWFLTLFGRDSLWAARMLLPVRPDLAASTLRVLARRQGLGTDDETGEQPGKILHEVRSTQLALADGAMLPPCYFGSIDSTMLWVILLHDAWRWGMPETQVQALLPSLRAALGWLLDYADADGDGFCEYADLSGHGLANQGWKDSGDSIQFRDGTLAEPPIALCEVQAYAYEAALAGASVLRAFGPGLLVERLEQWAAELRSKFRDSFWIPDAEGAYPAVALDGRKRRVDTVTSNLGHLLGTGLLDESESAAVAARLVELDAGFGLQTMSERSAGFNPLGYHTGSIWPHDTAVAVFGLSRAGFGAQAARLAAGVVAASVGFDGRLPELYAGHRADSGPGERPLRRPAPYPAACRPQAWSAASVVLFLQALLGLRPDAPGGELHLAPVVDELPVPLHLDGLRIGGRPLGLDLSAAGLLSVNAPEGIKVVRDLE